MSTCSNAAPRRTNACAYKAVCSIRSHDAIVEQVHTWLQETMRTTGIEPRMGHKLFAAFRSAGLPDPDMNLESMVVGGHQAPAHGWANVISAALPLMEKHGVTTREQLDPETLSERLSAELMAHDGIMITGPLIGAWTRKPASSD